MNGTETVDAGEDGAASDAQPPRPLPPAPRIERLAWLQADAGEELEIALEATKQAWEVRCFQGRQALPEAVEAIAQTAFRYAVFAQPRRGMWRADDVERVRDASPLTQLAGVFGSWCEGWRRTGHPLPVWQHYWHQWPLRVVRLRQAAPQLPTFGLNEQFSVTGDEAEQCLRASPAPRPAVVVSAGFRERQAIGEVLAAVGWTAVAEGAERGGARERAVAPETGEGGSLEPSRIVAVVWDGDSRDRRHLQRLVDCRDRWPLLPLLALTVAPRCEDWRRLAEFTPHILSKPCHASDLYGWLADVHAAERSGEGRVGLRVRG